MTTRVVELDGGLPWGFRMHGGADVQQPLRISRVNPGSKAANRGIREGDFITSINGQSTVNLSNSEAQQLLRNSGDTLKLGLNEFDSSDKVFLNYSPKARRRLRNSSSSQQERNSAGSYYIDGKDNEKAINFDKDNLEKLTAVASQKSTLSSNRSSLSSTAIQDQGSNNFHLSNNNSIHNTNMADNGNSSSKSKRRRQRRKNAQLKQAQNTEKSTGVEIMQENKELTAESIEDVINPVVVLEPDYTVGESNKVELEIIEISSEVHPDIPSINIETTEVVNSDDNNSNILCDGESNSNNTELSTLSLPLDEEFGDIESPLISPEDETTLRNFLGTLNLASSPECATEKVEAVKIDKATAEKLKIKKAKKRAELEKYFLPMMDNPRYLDVISEESSDYHSSTENIHNHQHNLKQGTPELEIPSQKMPDKKILVDAKILEDISPKVGICSSSRIESESLAEVVYIESSSTSPASSYTNSNRNSLEITDDLLVSKNDAFINNKEAITDLTPPPTPESNSPANNDKTDNNDNEVDSLLTNNANVTIYTNVISPPVVLQRSRSPSGSSEGSFCTAKYNPNSSVADMTSISDINSPLNLREICLNFIISQPFGEAVLQELADVSRNLEQLTNFPLTNNKNNSNFPVTTTNYSQKEIPLRTSEMHEDFQNWIGLQCDTDPRLVYLSPKQKLQLETQRNVKGEGDRLLESHEKFLNREASLHNNNLDSPKETVNIIKIDLPNNPNKEQFFEKQSDMQKKIEENMKGNEKTVNVENNLNNRIISKSLYESCQETVKETNERVVQESIKINKIFNENSINKSWKSCDHLANVSNNNLNDKYSKSSLNISNLDSKTGKSENINATNNPESSSRLLSIIAEEEGSRNFNTFPRHAKPSIAAVVSHTPQNTSDSRLKAKNLNEWLQLARFQQANETAIPPKKSASSNNNIISGSTNLPPPTAIVDKNNASSSTLSTNRETLKSRPVSMATELLLEMLQQQEREIKHELERLEAEKRELLEKEAKEKDSKMFSNNLDNYRISKKGDYAIYDDNKNVTKRNVDKVSEKERPLSMPPERLRQQMYEEYLCEMAERAERRQHKLIKLSTSAKNEMYENFLKNKLTDIENEFMEKVKEKQEQGKLNIDRKSAEKCVKNFEDICVTGAETLDSIPQHLMEFVDITKEVVKDADKKVVEIKIKVEGQEEQKEEHKIEQKEIIHELKTVKPNEEQVKDNNDKQLEEEQDPEEGIWTPGQQSRPSSVQNLQSQSSREDVSNTKEPIPPVWTPKSATSSPTVERKEFRPVNFQSPKLSRKNIAESSGSETNLCETPPPWQFNKGLSTSQSSPAVSAFTYTTPRLPKAQNPTITLLQKAREGQLPRGAHYLDQQEVKKPPYRPPLIGPGEVLYKIKNEYTSESDSERPKRMADLGPHKYEMGIGPVTRNGMPLTLRSEVKESNQSKWYKKMYDTIHKQKPTSDEYVTVRYKPKKVVYPFPASGYLSEPEPGAIYYDSDTGDYTYSKYATWDRRRGVPQKVPLVERRVPSDNNLSAAPSYPTSAPPPPPPPSASATSTISTTPKPAYNSSAETLVTYKAGKTPSDAWRSSGQELSKRPGKIENYTPGHSSISEKEAKQWWDEVMDIFNGMELQQKKQKELLSSHPLFNSQSNQPRSFINQALKESGYESDSTLVFRRKEETAAQTAQHLSPTEQKEAYKSIQKGGDVPLHGLRKPAPERPKESPRKYVENEVTIHYKTPVRQEVKECLSEDELAIRQAEAMKRIYEEERRRKYLEVSKSLTDLNQLQDINSRRHTDNFIPSQKSPIPLNRYDDFDVLVSAPPMKPQSRSPEPRLLAKALYNFVGQSSRELTFKKGDVIYVRRQIDKNWYEGEVNAMVGLFPVNYVEIISPQAAPSVIQMRKPHEGQARAKYNFIAQTHLELSLAKGELVTITRRVDENWFEGKIGGRRGIFPVSYVEVLIDPHDPPPFSTVSTKPVASPAAHSMLHNGTAGGKESMGSHSYLPSLPSESHTSYHAKPVQVIGTDTYGSLGRGGKSPVDQALHIETQSEPIAYRALYKYKPQNEDELELLEGDIVYVLEKCDDGWFVGSSDRSGAFGTFPGNYVEKV